MNSKHILIIACTAYFTNDALATTTANEPSVFQKREAGGYLSLGIGAMSGGNLYRDPQTLVGFQLSGAYYFSNGLFVEAPGQLNKFDAAFTFGYNLLNGENWELDVIGSTAHGTIRFTHPTDGFEKRETGYFGFRFAGQMAGLQLQTILAPIAKNSEFSRGLYASLWLAKSWQVKNWHFYSSVGTQYRNNNMLDYYYGVQDDAIAYDEYHASGGINLTYKAGFSKPLTEHWIVDGYLSYTDYADSIKESPYTKAILAFHKNRNDYGSAIGLSLRYVF